MDLDYGLGTISCKDLNSANCQSVVKGISLELREDSLLYGHKTVVT